MDAVFVYVHRTASFWRGNGAAVVIFARAAARMSLSTLGFVQYIGPTIMLFLSIFVFKESVSPVLLVGFALIWISLIVYAISSVRGTKLAKAS